MSSNSSDDDIPGLESVSSSEYVDDSDDKDSDPSDLEENLPLLPRHIDHKSPNYITAKKWLQQDQDTLKKQMEVITIYMYSPFLYGHAHQSDKWLEWCTKAGLLVSDINYNTGELSDLERSAVDVLSKAVERCQRTMVKRDSERTSPQNLAQLLQLAAEMRPVTTIKKAVRTARRRHFFVDMIKDFDGSLAQAGGTTNESVGKPYFVEVGCLYAVNQTAEHVQEFVKGRNFRREFEEQCAQDEKHEYDLLKKRGDELYKQGKYQEAVNEYSTTIICCPYSDKLYTNRALCYLELKQPKAALSDGLRAMFLKPDWPKGHARYLQALNMCGETERAQIIYSRYSAHFPSQKDQDLLKKAMVTASVTRDKKKIEPTEEDKVLKDKIMAICKQSSEAYLQGNNGQALFYYEESVLIAEQSKGWQHCMVQSDCIRFLVSLYYAYGCALLKKGSYEGAEAALAQFDTIIKGYPSVKFPPAYNGCGRAYILLHRHLEALSMAKQGLEVMPSYRPAVNFTWPGLEEVISECLPQNIEIRLQQLQQQCEPVCFPDAVCRYSNCLQYHASSGIRVEDPDYKGRVVLQCTESCSISYHSSCWRRFKSDSVGISTDRDFLLTPCLTPDCSGTIKVFLVYDTKRLKIRFDAPAEAVARKPSGSEAPSYEGKIRSTTSKKAEKARRRRGLEREKDAGVGTGGGAALGKEDTSAVQSRSSQEDQPMEEGGVENGSGDGDGEESEGGRRDSQLLEDFRRAEDGVVVINRQAEDEEGKEAAKPKPKKKKVKPKEREQQWNELFTLPERKGLVGEDACLEEENSHAWRPDPDAPFQPPDHLREAIEEFETKEVPSIGLQPRPLATPLSTIVAGVKKPPSDKEVPSSLADSDFIFSYFGEIFKNHGPLRPSDPRLADSVTFLPDDKKQLIENAGGLSRFLLTSPFFKSHGEVVCLTEDVPVIAASMNSESPGTEGSGNSASGGTYSNSRSDSISVQEPAQCKSKPSLSTLITEQNLSGPDALKFDEAQEKISTRTYGEQLGSGLNSPAQSPRLTSPIGSPSVTKRPPSSEGIKSPSKRLSAGQLDKKLRKLDTSAAASIPPAKTLPGSKSKKGTKKKLTLPSDSRSSVSSSKVSSTSQDPPSQLSTPDDVTFLGGLFDQPEHARDGVFSSSSSSQDSGKGVALDRKSSGEKEKERENGKSTSVEASGRPSLAGDARKETVVSTSASKTARLPSDRRESTKVTPSKKVSPQQQKSTLSQQPKEKEKGKGKQGRGNPSQQRLASSAGAIRPKLVGVCVQTDPPLTTEKWVMTDPVAPMESFKERYELAMREKKDLKVKLEESEDRRVKMQRDHKREVERLQKEYRQEAKDDAQEKIRELEGCIHEERTRVQKEKRDQTEQIRSLKAEIKSLTDKIERLKKDLVKKDQQIDSDLLRKHTELERAQSDRRKVEERLRGSSDASLKALQRATIAEVELISLRRETILRPGEQRLQEIDRICAQLVPGTDIHREWNNYRDKLKTALDCFQNAMDDQLRQVKAGRELATLDRVPNPAVPLPATLATFVSSQRMPMMRPPFIPIVPMRAPVAPPPPLHLVDPSALPGPGHPPQGIPMSMMQPMPQGATPLPSAASLPGMEPQGPADPEVPAPQSAVLPSSQAEHPPSKPKSSFDRIMEKLAPVYPHYSRDDFKNFLREVRRNNKNTLSGLSLDSIAEQVRDIIEAREKARGGAVGGAVSSQQAGSKGQLRHKQRLMPAVAVAPPPLLSSVEYDDEGSCIICYEDMDESDSSRLSCGHRFHTECIRSWFKEQNTCPTCRNHTLLPEEYPFLR